jgi:hypothetical protein
MDVIHDDQDVPNIPFAVLAYSFLVERALIYVGVICLQEETCSCADFGRFLGNLCMWIPNETLAEDIRVVP